MFLSLISIAFIIPYAKDEKWSGKYGYISAILILVSFLTRYIGLALFIGAVLYLLIDGRGTLSIRMRKIALISIIFLIPAALWMIRGAVIRRIEPPPPNLREFLSYEKELIVVNPGDPRSDTIKLNDLISRLEYNAEYYRGLLSDIVSGKHVNSKSRAWVITIILIAGFIYSVIRWRGIFEYYVFFYILIYISWTSLQGVRFLVPIIPFIFYYFIRAVFLLIDGFNFLMGKLVNSGGKWDNYRDWLVRIAIAVMVFFSVYFNWSSNANIIHNERSKPYYKGSIANFLNAVKWVRENTPPDAVIVSGRAPWVYMLSDRRAFTPSWVEDTNEVMDSILGINADYIINSPALYSYKYLEPVIKEKPVNFNRIHQNGDCVVYEVVKVFKSFNRIYRESLSSY
jgi:hypothetical protein